MSQWITNTAPVVVRGGSNKNIEFNSYLDELFSGNVPDELWLSQYNRYPYMNFGKEDDNGYFMVDGAVRDDGQFKVYSEQNIVFHTGSNEIDPDVWVAWKVGVNKAGEDIYAEYNIKFASGLRVDGSPTNASIAELIETGKFLGDVLAGELAVDACGPIAALIADTAGAPFPFATGDSVYPSANNDGGQWRIAYRGIKGDPYDYIQPGDFVRAKWNGGGQHSFMVLAIDGQKRTTLTTDNVVGNKMSLHDGSNYLDAMNLSSMTVFRLAENGKSLIKGGAGGETLQGSIAGDEINGGAGDDVISGGRGDDILIGSSGADILDGAEDIDTAVYSGARSSCVLARSGDKWTVFSGGDGSDTLAGIERLQFSDTKLALDIDGNAGKVAKILASVLGASAVHNEQYLGIGLQLLDGGMSYEVLAALAIQAAGANTREAAVDLLWSNLTGSHPTADQAKPFIDFLAPDLGNLGILGALAADYAVAVGRLDLAALSLTGLEYV